MRSNPSSRSRNASPMRSGFASLKIDSLSIGDDMHPVIHAGRVAVITGAANGIGRAAAKEFAKCVMSYSASYGAAGRSERLLTEGDVFPPQTRFESCDRRYQQK